MKGFAKDKTPGHLGHLGHLGHSGTVGTLYNVKVSSVSLLSGDLRVKTINPTIIW